jgi:type II secretory pathway pseudopilin PulG
MGDGNVDESGAKPGAFSGRREPLPAAVLLVALLDFASAAVLTTGALGSLAFLGHPTLRAMAGLSIALSMLAALYVLSGIALLFRMPGARGRQLLLSGFGVLAFPVGTVAHGLAFALFAANRGVAALYSGRPTDAWFDDERAALHRLRGAHLATAVAGLSVLVVAAATVLGTVAALAVPGLLSFSERGRQSRTLADMRAIAAAIESFAADHDDYLDAEDIGELRRALEPDYLRSFPSKDAWGNPFLFERFEDGGYRIRSYGKDGVPDESPGGPTDAPDADIILEDGEFVQWPEGARPEAPLEPPDGAAPVPPSLVV